MKIPSAVKPGLWGVAAGAIGMAIVGFSYLGWTTAATSEKLARETASAAVVSALVPFCVLKAQTDTNQATLAKFQTEQSSYSRGEIVLKAGWASFNGDTSSSDGIA